MISTDQMYMLMPLSYMLLGAVVMVAYALGAISALAGLAIFCGGGLIISAGLGILLTMADE